jgi:hypothetical protein
MAYHVNDIFIFLKIKKIKDIGREDYSWGNFLQVLNIYWSVFFNSPGNFSRRQLFYFFLFRLFCCQYVSTAYKFIRNRQKFIIFQGYKSILFHLIIYPSRSKIFFKKRIFQQQTCSSHEKQKLTFYEEYFG